MYMYSVQYTIWKTSIRFFFFQIRNFQQEANFQFAPEITIASMSEAHSQAFLGGNV